MNIHFTVNEYKVSERVARENCTTIAHQMIHDGDGRDPEELRKIAYNLIKERVEQYLIQGHCLKLTLNMETGELKPVRLLL